MECVPDSNIGIWKENFVSPEAAKLSFQRILSGTHPDLRPLPSEHASMAQQDLALHLTLRDIFSPLAQEISQTSNALTTENTVLLTKEFRFSSPFPQNYIHDWDELGLAVLDAQYCYDPTETLRVLYNKLKTTAESMGFLDDLERKELEELEAYLFSEAMTTDYSVKYNSYRPETPELSAALAGLLRINHINTSPEKLENYTGKLELGKYSSFVWLPTETEAGDVSTIARETQAPVGAYGEEFTKKLVLSTKILIRQADEQEVERSRSIANQHQALIERATARGRDERGLVEPLLGEIVKTEIESIDDSEAVVVNLDDTIRSDQAETKDLDGEEVQIFIGLDNGDAFEKSPLITVIEGIETITQTISLLMAEKMPGYDDPSELLEAIINKGLIGHLSLVVPMGFIGPLNRSGNFIKQLVITNDKGEVALNPEVLNEIVRLKKVQTEMYRAKFSTNRPEVVVTGYGCPMGRKTPNDNASGIQSLSEAMLHIFRSIPS